MGNGFWTALDKKKKSAISKINGLMQVTPSTIAYAVAQVLFLFLSHLFIEPILGTVRLVVL